MKRLTQLFAAICALAADGPASATIILGNTSTGSEMVFVIRASALDGTVANNWSYTLDLGVLMNSFNPDADQSWNIGVGLDTYGASLSSTQNLVWGVMSADENTPTDPDAKLMFTFRTDDTPLANGAGELVGAAADLRITAWGATSILPTNGDRLNERAGHNVAGNGQNSFKHSDLPAANADSWFDILSNYMSNIAALTIQNPAENTMGSLNDELMTVIMSWSGTGTTVDTADNHPGRWSLSLGSTSGTLTYTAAPVPVPAAVWLLGSALLGMVGVRRRSA